MTPGRLCCMVLLAMCLRAAWGVGSEGGSSSATLRNLNSVHQSTEGVSSVRMARKLMQHVHSNARRLHQGFLGSDVADEDAFGDDELAVGDRRRLQQFQGVISEVDSDDDEDEITAGLRRLQQADLATDVEDQYDEQDEGIDSYDSLGTGSDADSRFGFVDQQRLPGVDETESVNGRRRMASAVS